jgi:hypothetical protein
VVQPPAVPAVQPVLAAVQQPQAVQRYGRQRLLACIAQPPGHTYLGKHEGKSLVYPHLYVDAVIANQGYAEGCQLQAEIAGSRA